MFCRRSPNNPRCRCWRWHLRNNRRPPVRRTRPWPRCPACSHQGRRPPAPSPNTIRDRRTTGASTIITIMVARRTTARSPRRRHHNRPTDSQTAAPRRPMLPTTTNITSCSRRRFRRRLRLLMPTVRTCTFTTLYRKPLVSGNRFSVYKICHLYFAFLSTPDRRKTTQFSNNDVYNVFEMTRGGFISVAAIGTLNVRPYYIIIKLTSL